VVDQGENKRENPFMPFANFKKVLAKTEAIEVEGCSCGGTDGRTISIQSALIEEEIEGVEKYVCYR